MKAFLTALYFYVASFLLQTSAAEPSDAERRIFQETKAKAERGEAKEQYLVGSMYFRGEGVAKDEAEAVGWYRKAAEQNHAIAQGVLGAMYEFGAGVTKDYAEAMKWYRKSAEQGFAAAQFNLGCKHYEGLGVTKDYGEAMKWYRKAADQGLAQAQHALGGMYENGHGVERDYAEAVKWYRKAAEQNNATAQGVLGAFYAEGQGVEKDYVEAYAWLNLAAKADERSAKVRDYAERQMTAQQIAEGQKRTKELRAMIEAKTRMASKDGAAGRDGITLIRPASSGTGFFISDDGYFITNQHVAGEGATVRLLTAAGSISARVVKVDKANDLALLKAEGKFTALPVITSRGVRLGATAATVGFPNTGLQGFAPKLARGEIASLAGAQDDARHFQISAPIQPGNSGGALVDERGNVIGVVVAKLSQKAALATSGALAENVNYAVKSSYLLSFLESVPEVAAKLKEAHTKDRKFEDVVKSVEQATVLVLVY